MVARRSRHKTYLHPRIPVQDPNSLPPNGRRVLRAARQILREKGLDSITLDAVSAESGLNRAATRYYFGSKDGLISALLDAIVVDECLSLTAHCEEDTREQRVEHLLEAVRDLQSRRDSWTGFFDIFPWAIRRRSAQARMRLVYDLWYEWILEWMGIGAEGLDGLPDDLKGAPEVVAALIDGIALQAALYEEHYEMERVLATLKPMLDRLLGEAKRSLSS